MRTRNTLYFLLLILIIACDNNDPSPTVNAPATYSFQRGGQSTVFFTGQTTRIQMGEELNLALKDFSNSTEALMLEMYRNQTENGTDANPFNSVDLNAAEKSIKSKVAASNLLFSSNTAESAVLKADFESWITGQVAEIFPAKDQAASIGQAGQLADGTSTRYVNAKGLEYDQAVIKGLIGALMLDQTVNHYLSTTVLDGDANRSNNDEGTLVAGTNYTVMEHYWDEAYGYVFGNAVNVEDPMSELGASDSFLNKYLGRLEGDEDFAGAGQVVYDAFKLGRAAIVAGDYELRDAQARIIQKELSEMIGIRAVYYLQQAKAGLADQQFGTAFHDLSEGYGFIYSLRFTHNINAGDSYFTRAEVDGYLSDLYGSANGFWDLDAQTLDAISNSIADKFDFTLEEATN